MIPKITFRHLAWDNSPQARPQDWQTYTALTSRLLCREWAVSQL